MASNTHAKTERPAAAPPVPSVESFASNGDLTITLNRSLWMSITGALSIAAGQAALAGNYEQMFSYTGACNSIGARLGVTQQISGVTDTSPPLARAAVA